MSTTIETSESLVVEAVRDPSRAEERDGLTAHPLLRRTGVWRSRGRGDREQGRVQKGNVYIYRLAAEHGNLHMEGRRDWAKSSRGERGGFALSGLPLAKICQYEDVNNR